MAFQQHKVSLTEGQRDKLRIALKKKSAVSLKLGNGQLAGDIPLLLTKRQINQINKARQTNGGAVLNLSMKQVSHMHKQVSGGFLPALAAIAPFLLETVLPTVLGGVASYGVNKIIDSIDGKGVAGGNVPGGGYKKKAPRKRLTQQEISATGLFQFGVPYSKQGKGLVPLGEH